MSTDYLGYIQNGKPVFSEAVTLPENASFVLKILNDTPTVTEKAKKQRLAFEEFFAAMKEIKDEPITDEMLADFAQNRVNFTRELDL